MVLAVECNGAQVTTVEGLAHDEQLDPVQAAIIDKAGVQCGFCTPGCLDLFQGAAQPAAKPN